MWGAGGWRGGGEGQEYMGLSMKIGVASENADQTDGFFLECCPVNRDD